MCEECNMRVDELEYEVERLKNEMERRYDELDGALGADSDDVRRLLAGVSTEVDDLRDVVKVFMKHTLGAAEGQKLYDDVLDAISDAEAKRTLDRLYRILGKT